MGVLESWALVVVETPHARLQVVSCLTHRSHQRSELHLESLSWKFRQWV